MSEFWRMTPFELNVYAKAYARRREEAYDMDVLHAYLISRWVWARRLDVRKYLYSEKQQDMTDADMLQKVKALNALMGGHTVQVNQTDP